MIPPSLRQHLRPALPHNNTITSATSLREHTDDCSLHTHPLSTLHNRFRPVVRLCSRLYRMVFPARLDFSCYGVWMLWRTSPALIAGPFFIFQIGSQALTGSRRFHGRLRPQFSGFSWVKRVGGLASYSAYIYFGIIPVFDFFFCFFFSSCGSTRPHFTPTGIEDHMTRGAVSVSRPDCYSCLVYINSLSLHIYSIIIGSVGQSARCSGLAWPDILAMRRRYAFSANVEDASVLLSRNPFESLRG